MRGVYEVIADNVTVAGATTLVFINPGTNCSLKILRAWVAQSANATSAQQRVQLVTQVTAFPTLTSVTPRPTAPIDQASKITGGTAGAAGTCGVNASAEGGGAKTVLKADAFNVLNGWLWVATPQEQIIMSAGLSSGLGLYLPTAPATLTNWTAGIVFEEV